MCIQPSYCYEVLRRVNLCHRVWVNSNSSLPASIESVSPHPTYILVKSLTTSAAHLNWYPFIYAWNPLTLCIIDYIAFSAFSSANASSRIPAYIVYVYRPDCKPVSICLHICMYVYVYHVHLYLYLPALSVYVCVFHWCLDVSLCVYLYVGLCLYIRLFPCVSVGLYVCKSICSLCLGICLCSWVRLFIHMSLSFAYVCVLVHLFIRLSSIECLCLSIGRLVIEMTYTSSSSVVVAS